MKKEKKQNIWREIKQNFWKSVLYLKESRNYVYAVALIFLAGGILGFIFFENFSFIDAFLEEIIKKTEGMGAFELIAFIFQNNLWSAFISLIAGLVFGIFPVLNSIFNGIIIGYVMRRVAIANGILEFWRILPHGVFELPAVFISFALGLKLGMFLFSKNRIRTLRERALYSIMIFLGIILPLLLVAAIIEGVLIFVLR
ncbi:MAG: stage II sporulation protein M [Candidatus Pacearchaeota archaeon]